MTFSGKDVAVVGTGASGGQMIQEISKTAKSLTVFQRNPNWCTPLHNKEISKSEMHEIRKKYPEIFQICGESDGGFIHTTEDRNALNVTEEERENFGRSNMRSLASPCGMVTLRMSILIGRRTGFCQTSWPGRFGTV